MNGERMGKVKKMRAALAGAAVIMLLANMISMSLSLTLLGYGGSFGDVSVNEHPKMSDAQMDDTLYFDGQNTGDKMWNDFWEFSRLHLGKNADINRIAVPDKFACEDGNFAELIIGLDDTNQGAADAVLDAVRTDGGDVVRRISIGDKVVAILVDLPLDKTYSFIDRMQGANLVRYVEPNEKFEIHSAPNDIFWANQWGPRKIEAEYAWDKTVGSHSVLVAVIDTGIDYSHPDLAANYVPLGYDWINYDADPKDDHGHGTHCAGIIAAVLNNSLGVAGIANVSLMAEKCLSRYGSGSADSVSSGIIHAVDQGADILSLSLGASSESFLINDAIEYAHAKGALVIASAGNSASSVKNYPAACEDVIAVTATCENDSSAWFTSFGDWVEVAAPGVDIYSTVPTYNVTLNEMYNVTLNYAYLSGTSMACPHVAGVAALIWSQFPNATRDWVKAQLRCQADDLGTVGFDEYYGYGRINARKAVENPPDHDLLILKCRKHGVVRAGQVVALGVDVMNRGLNEEQNVTVQLTVNGSIVNSSTINDLAAGATTNVSFSWNPLLEGTYNVTFSTVPVDGEIVTENNVKTEMLRVKALAGLVLFDQNHFCRSVDSYGVWLSNLAAGGYVVDTCSDSVITANMLSCYDVLIISSPCKYYSSDELVAIRDFVINGGRLLVNGNSAPLPDICANITQFADISWAEWVCRFDTTGDIVPHEITEGVHSVWFGPGVNSKLLIGPQTEGIIRDGLGYGNIMLAVAEVGAGRIVCVASGWMTLDWYVGEEDNLRLANNMINWLSRREKDQHELTVRLEVPFDPEPSETLLINATVYNRGLSDETNVGLEILVNSTTTCNMTIPWLSSGEERTISCLWTPSLKATYNITAYTPVRSNENMISNNACGKDICVRSPMINPVEGQYTEYVRETYVYSGKVVRREYWNFTYYHYIDRHKIFVKGVFTIWEGLSGPIYAVINTMTRTERFYDPFSDTTGESWWEFWIETGLDIGSYVDICFTPDQKVNSSRETVFAPYKVDLLEIPSESTPFGGSGTYSFDKASGLLMCYNGVSANPLYPNPVEISLIDGNVPIGFQYEHDIGVDLDIPSRVRPGETILLNATAYNLGLNNEPDVQFQFFINDTMAANITISLLDGAFHVLTYPWTPAEKGIYNITAYVKVSGETVTINNIAIQMSHVRYVEVALISDYYELTDLELLLNDMEIGYDVYNFNNKFFYTENLPLLLKYKTVILQSDRSGVGMDGDGPRNLTSAAYSSLESYLQSGGNLLVTGQRCMSNDLLMAKLIRSSSTDPSESGSGNMTVVEENHPIMNGPYGNFPAGYSISGLVSALDGAKADTFLDATTVAELTNGFDKIIATESLPGKIVFWGGDLVHDWFASTDCETMIKNTLHWFLAPNERELYVYLQTPRWLEPGDSAMLNATVGNLGQNEETNVVLRLLINNSFVAGQVIPLLGVRASYNMSYPWVSVHEGVYNITLYTFPRSGELVTRNNLRSKIVPVKYAPRILAYNEYADLQTYHNVLESIDTTFGPNHILAEFDNYTQLDLLLRGKDVLLIPAQVRTDHFCLRSIGGMWSESLSKFVKAGGTIIACGTAHDILMGAKLLLVYYSYPCTCDAVHVTEPSDPLVAGIPSSFAPPSHTIGFVLQDEPDVNIAAACGLPVVLRKSIGQGHILLLGFYFDSSNAQSDRILANALSLVAHIRVSASPSRGPPGTKFIVTGLRAAVFGIVDVYWDSMRVGVAYANKTGCYTFNFTVPFNATSGIHIIRVTDLNTGRSMSTRFKVPLVTVIPSRGPVGTKVTVAGSYFAPESQPSIFFNDMPVGYATADPYGNLTFTFTMPISTSGTHVIKIFECESQTYPSIEFTIIDQTPLDIAIDAGTLHFRGEVAELYLQTTLNGILINTTKINAKLYGPTGMLVNYDYPENVTLIAAGLYKISYPITMDVEVGTYTLTVAAEYLTDTAQSFGATIKSFIVSPTLTTIHATLIGIDETTASIKTEVGIMRVNLEEIQLKIVAINGTIATIQTTLGIFNGTITSIKSDIATIIIPKVGQISVDISSLREGQAFIIPQYAIMALALTTAAGAIFSTILFRRKKTVETK